jgi:AGZA family xanthine/uracil permease-like MFS transporter
MNIIHKFSRFYIRIIVISLNGRTLMLNKYFEYKKHKTNFKTEVIAGVTTFLTMAYIMFLNPFILSGEFAGTEKGFFDFGAVFTATILATAIACFIMAFYGKTWPIGLAPGMGINAFVAYGVVAGMGYTPQAALGAVLVAGVLFLIISLTPIRAWLINSIPKSLKLGIGAGIGLFLAIIGLEIMGVVGDHPVTLVTIGDIKNPLVLLGCLAFVFMIVLEKMKIKGNIIIGILLFSIIAWATGLAKFNGVVGSIPPMTYLFEFDLKAAFTAGMSSIIFTLLFIDFFDTAGTLTSVANVAGKVDRKGKVQDINKAMLSDSVGTVAGAMMGTTTVTSYVESGAGVKAGGRTGMTSLVIGVLFLACLFFSPLATSLPKEIDGAALLYVAILFVRNITDIEWDDIAESGPAVLAMITMPLTYSISNGIALAFIAYALIKIFTGKFSKTSPAIWLIAVLSVLSFYVA